MVGDDYERAFLHARFVHEANAPLAGGMVLMADGAVRSMTAQEFASTPRATPSTGK